MAERVEYIFSLKDAMSSPLSSMQSKVNSLERSIKGVNTTGASLGGTLSRAFAVIGGAALGRDIVMTTARMESMKNAIMATSTDSLDGANNIDFLNSTVDRLGLNVEAAFKGFKTFNASLQDTALEGERGRKIFTQISEAATVLGLSGEDTEGVFLALGQMMSKGNVQAEELRGQLGERLPGAFQLAAKAMGITTKELNKQLQAGNVLAVDLLPKLGNAIAETYGGKLGKATNSLQANLNRLGLEWTNLKTELGTEFTPMIIKLVQVFRQDVVPMLRAVGGFVKEHASLFKALAIGIGTLWTVTKAMTIAQWGMNAAMSVAAINPYVLAIAGLVTLMSMLVSEYKEFKALQDGSFRKGLQDEIGAKKRKEGLEEELQMFQSINSEKEKQLKIQQEQSNINRALSSGVDEYTKQWLLGRQDALNELMGGGKGIKGGDKTTTLKSEITKVEGTKPQNFYLNITNLIEGGFQITTNNMKEGVSQAKEMVLKALIEAANDTAIVARSS